MMRIRTIHIQIRILLFYDVAVCVVEPVCLSLIYLIFVCIQESSKLLSTSQKDLSLNSSSYSASSFKTSAVNSFAKSSESNFKSQESNFR